MKSSWLCVALTGLIALAHAEARSERSLTAQESWSTFGGSNEKCSSGMGRCYADPGWDDCAASEPQDCIDAVKSDGNDVTCNYSSDPEANCFELGNQVSCLSTTTCDLQTVNGNVVCVDGAWRSVVSGPDGSTFGVDCQ